MKTRNLIKYLVGTLMVFTLIFVSFKITAQTKPSSTVNTEIDVSVTISKVTTEKELEEIQSMLAANAIESEFTNIERNSDGEILSINVNIFTKTNQSVKSAMSNNTGIGEVTFGRKNGQLFITQNGENVNNFAFFNFPGVRSFKFDNDSIYKQYHEQLGRYNNFFEDDNFAFSFGSTSELQELMDKIKNQMQSHTLGNRGNFSFVDDPDINTLIMIDGKESDFETLDKLSKDNKINEIDFLKPSTAVSIYGEKAKDGAVIATTKQNEKIH